MATPWLPSLQEYINEDNFSYNMADTTISSNMDTGPRKVRRRSTRPINRMTGSINLTVDEFNDFYFYFNTTLNGGVTPFEVDHPITGILTVFRFVGSPNISSLGGGNFRAAFEWEELP